MKNILVIINCILALLGAVSQTAAQEFFRPPSLTNMTLVLGRDWQAEGNGSPRIHYFECRAGAAEHGLFDSLAAQMDDWYWMPDETRENTNSFEAMALTPSGFWSFLWDEPSIEGGYLKSLGGNALEMGVMWTFCGQGQINPKRLQLQVAGEGNNTTPGNYVLRTYNVQQPDPATPLWMGRYVVTNETTSGLLTSGTFEMVQHIPSSVRMELTDAKGGVAEALIGFTGTTNGYLFMKKLDGAPEGQETWEFGKVTVVPYQIPATNGPIAISVGAGGTVTPNLNGQKLVFGRSYTMTAVPAAGYKFLGWTGSITNSNAKLQFTMQPGMRLEARFQRTVASLAAGQYKGLLILPGGTSADEHGVINVTLTRTFGSAKLGKAGPTRAIIQTVSKVKTFETGQITASNSVIQLELTYDGTAERATGTVLWNGVTYETTLYKQGRVSQRLNWIVDSRSDDTEGPAGYSPGTLKASTGVANVMVSLPDGNKVTYGSIASSDGIVPVYVFLGPTRGTIAGWLNTQGEGELHWTKAGQWNTIRKTYTGPGTPVAAWTGATVQSYDPLTVADISANLTRNGARISGAANNASWLGTLSAYGTVSGTAKLTGETAVGKWSGVSLDQGQTFYGFLLKNGASSRVILRGSI